jgi:hypothetical protein
MKKKSKKRKILLTMLVNLGIMTCIIQIPGEINAQEATIFEEEDYTLQLENYQKELDIDINEISYNSETDWDWSYYGGNHISKIAKERINRVEDVLTLGDEVKVICLGKDKMGRISFSIKDVPEEA